MKTIEIRQGSIDVRLRESTGEVCLVFEAADAQLRMFRTMPIEEARALTAHIQRVLGEVET